MNYIVLDDFPAWSTYILASFVLVTFWLAWWLLLRTLRRRRIARLDGSARARSIHPPWAFAIAASAALVFMASSMFGRFHAVAIDRLQLELIYLWPQSPVAINVSELVDIKLARAGRNCGHLEIATRQERYLSVAFRKCENAEALIKQVGLRSQ
ncbi:MAG: hypothetical protein EXR70_06685 [Deltaproteobacteria bacterium]|nr:hypothetical protein [Deltaproteobacteria bacterium]